MNRVETFQTILWLQALAARVEREEKALRATLDERARQELREEGTAPTWRFPDLGQVTLSVTTEQPIVTNANEWVGWVAERYPDEVDYVPVVRSSWQKAFFAKAKLAGEKVVDPATGEVVPGTAVKPGNQPLSLSVRPSPAAREVYAAVVDQGLRRLVLDAGPAVPIVLAEAGEVRDAA